MKLHLLIFLFSVSGLSCQAQTALSKESTILKFLYKTNFDTSSLNKGQHIEVKQVLPKTDELIPMSIDDRDIINRSGVNSGQSNPPVPAQVDPLIRGRRTAVIQRSVCR